MSPGDSDRTRALHAPEPGDGDSAIVLRVSARSDRGLVRENNEDSYCVSNLSLPPEGDEEATEDVGRVGPKGVLLAVSDGMGGQEAGEVASRLAVDTLRDMLRREWGARAERDAVAELRNDIRTAIDRANRSVLDHVAGHPGLKGMGATLTAAVVLGRRVVVAHVGDSRCYLLRAGFLKALTADQSLAEELVRRSVVQRGSPAYEARKSVLTRAVGQAGELDPDWEIVDLARGDRLLLCSDGLYGPVEEEDLRSLLAGAADPEDAVEELLAAARDGGAPDNVTCIVAFLTGPGLPDAKGIDADGGTVSIRIDARMAALADEETLTLSGPDSDETGEFEVQQVKEDDTLAGVLAEQAAARVRELAEEATASAAAAASPSPPPGTGPSSPTPKKEASSPTPRLPSAPSSSPPVPKSEAAAQPAAPEPPKAAPENKASSSTPVPQPSVPKPESRSPKPAPARAPEPPRPRPSPAAGPRVEVRNAKPPLWVFASLALIGIVVLILILAL